MTTIDPPPSDRVLREDHCKGCKKRILWIKTANRKWMPVDPELITIICEKDRRIYRGYIPHHSTCPEVHQFRKR